MTGKTSPKVLVLLIGEVLEDPRVYKTCRSLSESGAEVTVACTNPSGRPERETCDYSTVNSAHTPDSPDNNSSFTFHPSSFTLHPSPFNIIRFPHRKEFAVKSVYNWLQGKVSPGFRRMASTLHEEVPASPVRAAVRNAVLSLNFRHYLKSSMKINRMMIREFTGKSFDLVHCNDVDTLHAGNALKRSGAAKEVLYDAHEYWPGIGVHGSKPNDALGDLEAEGIKNADYVVTVNSFIADMIEERYGLEKKPAVVMNCPWKYEGTVQTGSVHSPVRIIYQGKVQAFRGIEELVLAFKHIDGAELTVSGRGPLVERLRLLSVSEGIEEKVRLTGEYFPEDALRILNGHDIGVLPFNPVTLSITYSSPNKLFDYAMSGLAMAANDLPFLKQVIVDNEMGKIFDSNDPESIAETLNGMIADTETLKKFKSNARKTAKERYYWDIQFKEYPWSR